MSCATTRFPRSPSRCSTGRSVWSAGFTNPEDDEQLTRGVLIDANGVELETVVLGRVLTLMRRHLAMDQPHLWVVYPRCRDSDQLHLQIAGIWEPSTLDPDQANSMTRCRRGMTIFRSEVS